MRTVKVQGRTYELASFMARLGGQFLDGLICLFLLLGGLLIGGLIIGWTVGLVIGIIQAILYLLFQDGLANGQSLGKQLVKTKVIDATTSASCTFGQSFIRNLILTILGLIDWVFIFGEKRQRLGDRAAGTLVVKLNKLPEE